MKRLMGSFVVLVTYKEWVEHHYMLPDTLETRTKVVEVEKIADIQQMFSYIVDVKVLESNRIDNKEYMYIKPNILFRNFRDIRKLW